jgi:hypothetical protein
MPIGGRVKTLHARSPTPDAKAENSGALFAQNLFLADASSGHTKVTLSEQTLTLAPPPIFAVSRDKRENLGTQLVKCHDA